MLSFILLISLFLQWRDKLAWEICQGLIIWGRRRQPIFYFCWLFSVSISLLPVSVLLRYAKIFLMTAVTQLYCTLVLSTYRRLVLLTGCYVTEWVSRISKFPLLSLLLCILPLHSSLFSSFPLLFSPLSSPESILETLMTQVPDNPVSEWNDPGVPIAAVSKLAKGKRNAAMSDTQRMSQLEDIIRGNDQRLQDFMIEIYEAMGAMMPVCRQWWRKPSKPSSHHVNLLKNHLLYHHLPYNRPIRAKFYRLLHQTEASAYSWSQG